MEARGRLEIWDGDRQRDGYSHALEILNKCDWQSKIRRNSPSDKYYSGRTSFRSDAAGNHIKGYKRERTSPCMSNGGKNKYMAQLTFQRPLVS
jgi:hypothetical protein